MIIFLFLFIHFSLCADVYKVTLDGFHELSKIDEKGFKLPNELVIGGNIYEFQESNFQCYEDGLYRFFIVPNKACQKIVFNGNIDQFIHSLTWIHGHGYLDDRSNYNQSLSISNHRRIFMTCGSIVQFANNLCNSLGIISRFILILTLDPWNSYNNGHSLLEVYDRGKWKLWDIDQRMFFQSNGKDLNALEFIQSVKIDDYTLVQFSKSPCLSLGDLKWNGYDYSFWYEGALFSKKELKTFYKRSAKVLLIKENEIFYFTCPSSEISRIKSYDSSFIYLDEATFINKFYI